MEATESENRSESRDNNNSNKRRGACTFAHFIAKASRVFTKRCEIDYFPDVHFARVPLVMKIAARDAMKIAAEDL